MSKRYEAQDSTGARVWLQDGAEVYEAGDEYRACHDPSDAARDDGWVPGTFATVDEAFMAIRIHREMAARS